MCQWADVYRQRPIWLGTVLHKLLVKHRNQGCKRLALAGELQTAFTTELLIGIGETKKDWWKT